MMNYFITCFFLYITCGGCHKEKTESGVAPTTPPVMVAKPKSVSAPLSDLNSAEIKPVEKHPSSVDSPHAVDEVPSHSYIDHVSTATSSTLTTNNGSVLSDIIPNSEGRSNPPSSIHHVSTPTVSTSTTNNGSVLSDIIPNSEGRSTPSSSMTLPNSHISSPNSTQRTLHSPLTIHDRPHEPIVPDPDTENLTRNPMVRQGSETAPILGTEGILLHRNEGNRRELHHENFQLEQEGQRVRILHSAMPLHDVLFQNGATFVARNTENISKYNFRDGSLIVFPKNHPFLHRFYSEEFGQVPINWWGYTLRPILYNEFLQVFEIVKFKSWCRRPESEIPVLSIPEEDFTLIGQGSEGVIYKFEHNGKKFAAKKSYLYTVCKEADGLEKLNFTDLTPRYYGIFRGIGEPMVVMELGKESLASAIEKKEDFSDSELGEMVAFGLRLERIIQELEIHLTDIKPGNFILTEQRKLKAIDIGGGTSPGYEGSWRNKFFTTLLEVKMKQFINIIETFGEFHKTVINRAFEDSTQVPFAFQAALTLGLHKCFSHLTNRLPSIEQPFWQRFISLSPEMRYTLIHCLGQSHGRVDHTRDNYFTLNSGKIIPTFLEQNRIEWEAYASAFTHKFGAGSDDIEYAMEKNHFHWIQPDGFEHFFHDEPEQAKRIIQLTYERITFRKLLGLLKADTPLQELLTELYKELPDSTKEILRPLHDG